MFPHDIWQGIDIISFMETAILLEVKYKSQGKLTKGNFNNENYVVPQDTELGSWTQRIIPEFLDDFALVAAGSGGKEHICSVCADISNSEKNVTLRVTQNDGVSTKNVEFLSNLVQCMMRDTTTVDDFEKKRNDLHIQIIQNCRAKLRQKTLKLKNVLKSSRLKPYASRKAPGWRQPIQLIQEASKDAKLLGPYSKATHIKYMEVCGQRMKALEDLLNAVSNTSSFEDAYLLALTKSAYEIRRSTSFKTYIQANIAPPRSRAEEELISSHFENIMERIGKISRFYRAAITMAATSVYFAQLGNQLEVKGLDTHPIEIPELSSRTVGQIRSRGGHRFQNTPSNQLTDMLRRWDRYRQHAEIQLLVFYEENPEIKPLRHYIGCSKMCCYLCYSFIQKHGNFEVNGCHQSLYSLWTIQRIIKFADKTRATAFRNSLIYVSENLQEKLNRIKDISLQAPKFSWEQESVANLSRSSLPLSDIKPMRNIVLRDAIAIKQLDQVETGKIDTNVESKDTIPRNVKTAIVASTPLPEPPVVLAEEIEQEEDKPSNKAPSVREEKVSYSSSDSHRTITRSSHSTGSTLRLQPSHKSSHLSSIDEQEGQKSSSVRRQRREKDGQNRQDTKKRNVKIKMVPAHQQNCSYIEVRKSQIVYRRKKDKTDKEQQASSKPKRRRKHFGRYRTNRYGQAGFIGKVLKYWKRAVRNFTEAFGIYQP